MSRTTQAVFAAIKEGIETIQAVAPGLSMEKIGSDIAHEATQQLQHGAHEVSAALYTGSAFVMYPRNGKEDNAQDQTIEVPQTPQVEQDHDHGR